ncbi:hypothetical protein VTL71DRAFT_15429 [Oculimacula yallundae]|uniref:Uncharacterized protein n=1 Tax=Oculimacula yallundae TaxID=86028 RepID=A0ABR4CIM8_9HELO
MSTNPVPAVGPLAVALAVPTTLPTTNPLAGPIAPLGGITRPAHPIYPHLPPGYIPRARRSQRNINHVLKTVPVAPVPEPKKEIRVYTLEEFADRINVEAAIAEHFARSQKPVEARLASVADIVTKGVTYIGFQSTGSRVLPMWELVNYVLATKSVATQVFDALKIDPIPLIITINLTLNEPFLTDNELGAPSIAECEVSTKEEFKKIVPFHLKKLPAEVRKMIYGFSDILAVCHDNQLPAFVQAALCDKFLQEEVKEAYKKINYVVTHANETRFRQFKVQEIQSLNHLYLQWGHLGVEEYRSHYLSLRAARCQIMNKLRTLTDDYTTSIHEPASFSLIQSLSRASNGVTRISARLHSIAYLESTSRRGLKCVEDILIARCRLIEHSNLWIRAPGRLVTVAPADVDEEWFWERETGGFLEVGPEGMASRKEGPAKGNRTLEDTIAGRSILVR